MAWPRILIALLQTGDSVESVAANCFPHGLAPKFTNALRTTRIIAAKLTPPFSEWIILVCHTPPSLLERAASVQLIERVGKASFRGTIHFV